jgi:prepilin-type N-terminal cleavage/methylation domain-containing protein
MKKHLLTSWSSRMKPNKLENMPVQQKGYTLVELAIAVAILAVLIVAGLTGVQGILTSGKVNDQIKTMAKLGSKISANYGSLSTSGISVQTVASLGGWDTSKVSGTGAATAVRSAFNSGEFVTTNTAAISGIAANAGVIYTIGSVPREACPDLANGIGALAFGIAVQAAASPTVVVTTYPGAPGVQLKTPGTSNIDPATLATGCALNASSDFIIAIKP